MIKQSTVLSPVKTAQQQQQQQQQQATHQSMNLQHEKS